MEEKINKFKEIVAVVTLLLYIVFSFMSMFHAGKQAFLILAFVYVANFLVTVEVICLMSKRQLLKGNVIWIIMELFSNMLALLALALILFNKI